MPFKLGQSLKRWRRPGFLTRLAHFILIQVLFVFAAVALLVFFPTDTRFMMIAADRGQLQYALFFLFLCSVLVSLLVVYLLSRRFKQPLHRLITGLEKTAKGELFYLPEPFADLELQRLAEAFNSMSASLWEQKRQLQRSNQQLSRSNEMLLQSQVFLATLIENSPTSVVVTDADEKIIIFNRMATDMFGLPGEDAVGRPLSELFANEYRLTCRERSADEASSREVLCRRSGGSVFPAYLVASPIRGAGKGEACLLLIRDISESKSFQEMMIRLDRYYTRGEMAGAIAHEMNNYLSVLSGNIELMPLYLGKGDVEKAEQKLQVMKQTVDRIAQFANGLMDSDPDRLTLEFADLNQIVENTVAFLKPQNKFDGITIRTSLASERCKVPVDVAQIEQLLVNLLQNSADALQESEGSKEVFVSTAIGVCQNEKCAVIEVRDCGPGVPENRRYQLFEKRFTTKRRGHGLGLITCRKIVEAHQGSIEYRYQDGAVFTVAIPVRRSTTPATVSTDDTPAETAVTV